MTAVAGSGIKIMSDSLIPFQPAIDEPSNILPSLKKPSSTNRVGTVTCCSLPIVSVNRRSANFASFSLINFRTSAGIMFVLTNWVNWPGIGRGPLAMQLMCHCVAYTDQALAIRQRALCIIMDRQVKIRALIWCVARSKAANYKCCECRRASMSELGARGSLRLLKVAPLYSLTLPSPRAPDGPRRIEAAAHLSRTDFCTAKVLVAAGLRHSAA